jgi:hypothetical protein
MSNLDWDIENGCHFFCPRRGRKYIALPRLYRGRVCEISCIQKYLVMNGFKQTRSGSHPMTPMDVLTMPAAEPHQGSTAHGASGTMPEQGNGNFFIQTVPVRMAQRAPSHPFSVGFGSLNSPASWTRSDCSRWGRSLHLTISPVGSLFVVSLCFVRQKFLREAQLASAACYSQSAVLIIMLAHFSCR